MPYATGYYTPDWTGQYGSYDFNSIKVWLPDQARFPYDETTPYKVFITTLGNKESLRLDVNALTGVDETFWFATPLEYKFLENGWAVAAIGYDGVRTGEDFQTETYSKGRFFPYGHANGAWDIDEYTSPQRDFAKGVQYLKRQAVNGVGSINARLNKAAFIGYGLAEAGQAVSYSCLHNDMVQSGASDFTAESTRLKGMFLVNSQSDYLNFVQSDAMPDYFRSLPNDDSVTNTGLAGRQSLVDDDVQIGASTMYYGFQDTATRTLNSDGVGVVWYSTGTPQNIGTSLAFTGTDGANTFKYPSDKEILAATTETATSPLGIHDPWHGAILIKRLRDIQKNGWHDAYSYWLADEDVQTGAAGLGWDLSPDYTFNGTSLPDLFGLYQFVLNWANSITSPADNKPEYHLDVYGDASIAWVPPVKDYTYHQNIAKRGLNDRTFRWGEVQIPMAFTQTGAIINYTMPDQYVLQITPDLGWHDELAMFGDPSYTDGHNPHLKNIGPLSIQNGLLTDNTDGSVQYTLSESEWSSAIVDGFDKHLWRAVAWGDGNPGIGGLPQKFENVSSYEQLQFTVDDFIKETRRPLQVISGKKSKRVAISVSSSNINSTVVEQTETTWKVSFLIDRPDIKFTIVATDSGGSAVGKHQVDLDYSGFEQYLSHVWNSFDGFAAMAGVERLPNETNADLKTRTIDAYIRKGSSNYDGLISSINREVGLSRFDRAVRLRRAKTIFGRPAEESISVESNHTRVSVIAPSFFIVDEVRKIDSYYNVVTLAKRINEIDSIKTADNVEIPKDFWHVTDEVDGNEVWIDEKYRGNVKVSYSYKEDVLYSQYPVVAAVVNRLNEITNPSGIKVIEAVMDKQMGGHERSSYLYKYSARITSGSSEKYLGWSRVGLFRISDEEYKWSFADSNSMFFNSQFYEFVLELKSLTNIEWGFVIADQDFWDAVDAEHYGRDALPIVFDPDISHFVTAVPIKANQSIHFDPWESYSMGYHFNKALIKNVGFPREAFKSGVGFRPDCAVSVKNVTISAEEVKINHSATVQKVQDSIDFTKIDVTDIIIDI